MRTKLALFCDKIIEAGWLAALIAVPLFFNIYSARTFEPDKITLLRSIVLVMSLAWIVSVVEKGLSNPGESGFSLLDRWRRWLKIPLFLPTGLLVLVYLISTIFSLTPTVSFWGSYQRMQGTYSTLSYIVLFALTAGNLRTREQVDRLVTTVIVTSIPISLYGIIQKYGLDPLPWAGDETTRVAANMGNAIFVASYLTMTIPLTLSRLVESMTTIIKEEQSSWGHTILAAIYIFTLVIQIITVVFSLSRGPMLGILASAFVMGLLIFLILRQYHSNSSRLSIKEIGFGLGFVALLGLAGAAGGGLGFLIGLGLENLLLSLNYSVEAVPFLGAAIGGLLGFFALYVFMAASDSGWRWLWLSWLGIAGAAIGFVLVLNLHGTSIDPYLDVIRDLPYVNRLANVIETEGTGKVRVLIWDAAMQLIVPHPPLGIPDDDIAPPDAFNSIRPLIGYGPESMFNAFAYVYPVELAYVENRGSSADRSHNETMDSLVITGMLGFLAFYFLMVSVFYYSLSWLGWAPDKGSKRRLILFLIAGGISGAIAAYVADKGLTFVPLGLPFGLVAGSIGHLIWQGFISQSGRTQAIQSSGHPLLLIGLLGAFVGHFIEVHFVFSIAATYTYFWIYAGLMLALFRINAPAPQPTSESLVESDAVEQPSAANIEPAPTETPRNRRARRAQRAAAQNRKVAVSAPATSYRREPPLQGEGQDAWIGSQGLVMAIILIILTFDFITPQFQFKATDQDSMSLLWMMVITFLAGLVIALADLTIRRNEWGGDINLPRAAALYTIPSLIYFFIYMTAHQTQLSQRITVTGLADVIRAADVITGGFVMFYVFLFILMVLFALTLSWRQNRRLTFWRAENWWLYPPLVLATVAVIWFKNVDVVLADIYLKEGERYRSSGQWNEAIALHETGRSIDSDEDFYYLMLALDYQLMAQDSRIEQGQREFAWKEGERIALEARRINPYNPDNTGNMGRYYFTLGQAFDRSRFQDALTYFEKATILAPSNVIYHNLWGQTYYILADYPKAIERLKISVSIDSKYPPSWILLGDTYAAMQNMDEAFKAHSQSIKLGNEFFDQFVEQRFNFYKSANRMENLIAVIQEASAERATDTVLPWAIGHAYNLEGQPEKAVPYLEKAVSLGDSSERTLRELANLYLGFKKLEQAQSVYQRLLQTNPNDVEANSGLAFIYAQQGRLDEAIQANQTVLQQKPNDYDSLKNLAILYQQKGQLQDALNMAKQAKSAAPAPEAPNWDKFISDIENKLAKAG
ncbi:MAG: tetratricopeptide repeat protein [Anaerolineae bacterium]